jgi:hypothetical protein
MKGMFGNVTASSSQDSFAPRKNGDAGMIYPSELWWKDNYDMIKRCGYELRPRYSPDWEPSWITTGKDFFTVEDGQPCLVSPTLLVPAALTDYTSYGLH